METDNKRGPAGREKKRSGEKPNEEKMDGEVHKMEEGGGVRLNESEAV